MTTVFKVKNLDCANCAKKLELAISKLKNVDSANLVFMTGKLIVESNEDANVLKDIITKTAKKVEPEAEIELA